MQEWKFCKNNYIGPNWRTFSNLFVYAMQICLKMLGLNGGRPVTAAENYFQLESQSVILVKYCQML